MSVFFCISAECPSRFFLKFVAGLATKCPVKEKFWSQKKWVQLDKKRWGRASLVEQAHQRLGVAEGVIRELQAQVQRVNGRTSSSSRSTAVSPQRNERSPQSNRFETTFQVGGAKSLMPDRFGKMSGPSWSTWSYLSRDFIGVVHSVLKQAMKTAEKRGQPVSESNIQDFGVTTEMDQ